MIRAKTPALLVKASKSYAEVVSTIKEHMGPTDFGNNFKYFKKSKKGELIIEFANHQGSENDIKKVKDKLSSMNPGIIGKVVSLGRPDKVEILDIDPSSSEKEILDALKAAVPVSYRERINVTGVWQTNSGFVKASAIVPRGFHLSIRHVNIGFFKCRVRQNTPTPPRCYRCHDHGHIVKHCERPDLRGTCLRCASKDHSTGNCTEGPDRCDACNRWGLSSTTHKPGSAQCGARQRARWPATANTK